VSDPGASDDPVVLSVAAYSDQAEQYEVTHAPKMAETAARFAASLPVPSSILDAGCGPGRDLARFIAHGHAAHGVDLNPRFVAMARRHGPTTLGDLRRVGELFPPASFDGVWAASSLVHLSESEAAAVLAQLAGLLRPGGRLYACVKSAGDTGWLDEPDGRRWYTVWEPDRFADAVAAAGLTVERVDAGVFVEVWASRPPGP